MPPPARLDIMRTGIEARSKNRYRAPTRQQELLLKATLLQGSAAGIARHQWRLHIDPERLDYDSQRLLPHLCATLLAHGISTPEMGRLKGAYRRTWYENTVRLHAAARLLRGLRIAGVETMLLKGAALTLRYYRDCGLRPMNDLDILVPTHQAGAAIEALKALGLAPMRVRLSEAQALRFGHAYPYRDAGGREVDLHWHLFYQRVAPRADAAYWAAADSVTLHGESTRILDPADQLLHVCVHGTQVAWWSPERAPSLRWVADAMMILTDTAQELDWDRFFEQARRLRFVLPVQESLGYLGDALDAPIPADAMMRLRRTRASFGERVAHRWGHVPLWQLPLAAAFRVRRTIRGPWRAAGRPARKGP